MHNKEEHPTYMFTQVALCMWQINILVSIVKFHIENGWYWKWLTSYNDMHFFSIYEKQAKKLYLFNLNLTT